MKFLQIVPVYPNKLAFKEDYFTWPAVMMRKKGYDCEFLTLRKKGEKCIEEIGGFKVRRFSSTLSLLFYILRQDCLVHAYLRPYPPSLFVGLLPKKKLLTPVTYELGSSAFVRWLSVLLMKKFSKIIPLTPYEEELYRKHGMKNLERIPLAIDYDMFSHPKKGSSIGKKFGIDDGKFTIITVANFRYVKRIDILLRAFKEIRMVKDARLIIIGEDRLVQENKPTIAEMIKELKLRDVIHLDYQPAKTISKILAYADVFVNTSALEAQCLAVYEAAASSIPLCLSRVLSFTSVFGSYVLYHDVEDYNQLAKNILTYKSDSQLVKKNTAYLKNFVKEWDYEVVKAKMWAAYREVLKLR